MFALAGRLAYFYYHSLKFGRRNAHLIPGVKILDRCIVKMGLAQVVGSAMQALNRIVQPDPKPVGLDIFDGVTEENTADGRNLYYLSFASEIILAPASLKQFLQNKQFLLMLAEWHRREFRKALSLLLNIPEDFHVLGNMNLVLQVSE